MKIIKHIVFCINTYYTIHKTMAAVYDDLWNDDERGPAQSSRVSINKNLEHDGYEPLGAELLKAIAKLPGNELDTVDNDWYDSDWNDIDDQVEWCNLEYEYPCDISDDFINDQDIDDELFDTFDGVPDTSPLVAHDSTKTMIEHPSYIDTCYHALGKNWTAYT